MLPLKLERRTIYWLLKWKRSFFKQLHYRLNVVSTESPTQLAHIVEMLTNLKQFQSALFTTAKKPYKPQKGSNGYIWIPSLIEHQHQKNNLKCLIEAIRSLEQVSCECYEEDNNLTSNEFVEMMLIDGCFILEMLRREAGEVSIDEYDPVFRTTHIHFRIKHDMILLENQIPLLILQCLYDLTTAPEHEGCSFIELCLNYLDTIVPMDEGINWGNTNLNPNHLLDLLCNSFIPPTTKMKYDAIEHINCAKELREAGIAFEKKDNASSLFEITFKDGVFKIPTLRVEDSTETLFRNLIALEQCYGDCDFITSYVFLMDNLISSTKDVELLRNKGIITNGLGSDKELSDVINKLCKEVVMGGFQFKKLCDDVNAYYKNIYHKWHATLKRDYFNTPWMIISTLLAAILLLLLIATGTLFDILSFSVHSS
ncbi:hypothetical protein HHK36_007550 [Tetracentron sinense]|uniref:Uncharacterized protein n=1 Tax=Tetracentron sinense TaxID=13715 RepID=A0A834ZMU2_TETSI|nr:hypothetical protein HHK36_007550 [Tetracentron sinense]